MGVLYDECSYRPPVYIEDEILYWADYYKLKDYEEFWGTICGESHFRPFVFGDSGSAYGLAQFHEGTFYAFSKEMGYKEAQYDSWKDHVRVMAWAFSQGDRYKAHWTVWRNRYADR